MDGQNLNVHFSEMMPETQIPSDPQSIPILYRTGHDAFEFSGSAERLRVSASGGT